MNVHESTLMCLNLHECCLNLHECCLNVHQFLSNPLLASYTFYAVVFRRPDCPNITNLDGGYPLLASLSFRSHLDQRVCVTQDESSGLRDWRLVCRGLSQEQCPPTPAARTWRMPAPTRTRRELHACRQLMTACSYNNTQCVL